MADLILITGGARSGKSSYAEQLARDVGERVLYVATAIGFDAEMQDRIARHRQQRPAHWDTWEGYQNLKTIFDDQSKTYDVILLDCITLLVSNWILQQTEATMVGWDGASLERLEQRIIEELRSFLDEAIRRNVTVIMVTNEVGFGIVPENQLARIFRDVAGRVNQYIATRARTVYLVVCGQALQIK